MTRSIPPNSSESSANTFGTCSWSFTSSEATAIVMPGCCSSSSALQLVESVGAPGTQREVAPLGRERPGHARAQAGAGTGDQDLLPSHPDSVGHAMIRG